MLRSTSTVTLLSGSGGRTPGAPSRRVEEFHPRTPTCHVVGRASNSEDSLQSQSEAAAD